MYGYIYITTNLINSKKYIGKHRCNTFDKSYLGSGKYFGYALNKYGRENFKCVMVHEAYSKEELNALEKYYISFFKANIDRSKYYNIASGGDGGNSFAGYTESEMETFRKKMSILNSGENNPMYGKHHTEETKEKIINSWLNKSDEEMKDFSNKMRIQNLGRKHNDDFCAKKSIAATGHNNPMSRESKANNAEWTNEKEIEWRNKIRIGNTGKVIPEDVRIRIGESVKKSITDDERMRRSVDNSGSGNGRAVRIQVLFNDEEYIFGCKKDCIKYFTDMYNTLLPIENIMKCDGPYNYRAFHKKYKCKEIYNGMIINKI